MRSDDIPQDVLYDAAEWYATLYADDCTVNERQAWLQWLNSHPLHQQAWQRVEQIHTRFHCVDKTIASSVLSRQGTERRHLLKLLALMTLLGSGAYSVPWETYAAEYRTAKGENRRPLQQPQAAMHVMTGQQITFTETLSQALQPVDRFRQSWRDGVLLADNMRLDSVMREYARYHNGYFPIDDKVAALRISGVFPLLDDTRFFSALTRTLPVTVERRFPWWITLRAR